MFVCLYKSLVLVLNAWFLTEDNLPMRSALYWFALYFINGDRLFHGQF